MHNIHQGDAAMQRYVTLLMGIVLVLAGITGCSSDDATSPSNLSAAGQSGVFDGEIGNADFAITLRSAVGEDHPLQGPFVLRGYNVRYDAALGATICDLTITNKGEVPHNEPVGITFMTLLPDGVQILNPDNDEHGNGAAIVFEFANDGSPNGASASAADGMWAPGEESLPRETQFEALSNVAIGFVARLDISTQPPGGSIGGVVWHDANENGDMDPGEDGLGGVPILLESTMDPPDSMRTAALAVDRTLTADDGSYRFDGLDAGFYTVGKALNRDYQGTTPNPLFVILTEDTNGVSSFLMANFGCVPVERPPEPELSEGDYVAVNGVWNGDNGYIIAMGIDWYDCESDTSGNDTIVDPRMVGLSDGDDGGDDGDRDHDWRDWWEDHDCREWICRSKHGKIRGPVTAVDSTHISVMGSKFVVKLIRDHSSKARMLEDIEVGDRIEARVWYGENGWIAYRLRDWRGDKDQVHGFVEAMDRDKHMFWVFDTGVFVGRDKDEGGDR